VADTSGDFIYVRERRLPYETFDADNHLYENRDALTKFLPREYQGAVKYVEVGGRTKLAVRDHISEYIPIRRSRGWRFLVVGETPPATRVMAGSAGTAASSRR